MSLTYAELLLKRGLAIVALCVVVFAALCGGSYAWMTRPSKIWRQLPSPPEQAIELLAVGERFGIYVKGKSGSIYRCNIYVDECTEEDAEGVTPHPDICGAGSITAPEPPGTPSDTMEVLLCGPDMTIQESYALLTDGTIWEWSHTSSWSDGMLSLVIATVGSIITVFAGLIWLTWRVKKDKAAAHPSRVR